MRTDSVLRRILRQFIHPTVHDGQALVEYSLIFVLCIIVCFTIVRTVGNQIIENYWRLVGAMP
ncbi:MAG TPA: hypothetical protein VIL01_10820 [Thermomicrobiales bacterium]